MNLIFCGAGAFGLPSLHALAGSAHRLVQVVSQPDRPAGRGKVLTPTPVSQWALEHQVPLLRTDNANAPELIAQLRELQAEVLVVIAFGQKLSDELLSLFPHGGINLHSSLLPRFRGAAPINWAVLKGDAESGVSVITVTNIMDGGDILATARTPIGPAETAGELHDRLAELGAPLLPQVLDALAAGRATRTKQDPALKTAAPKLSREMSWIDFSRPAAEVSARIRGLSPWPGVMVELTDPAGKVRTQATVLKCQASDSSAVHPPEKQGTVLGDHTVACGVGSVGLLTVQPVGKKPMDVRAFANGYGFMPGAALRSVVPIPAR